MFSNVYRGDQVVEVSPGVKKNVFRCIQWKRISDESYFYYIKHGTFLLKHSAKHILKWCKGNAITYDPVKYHTYLINNVILEY